MSLNGVVMEKPQGRRKATIGVHVIDLKVGGSA